jgi:nitrite reductase (NO-forming)
VDRGQSGQSADGTEIEHHNLPASATPTDLEAAQGKLNFESKCVVCHSHGGSEPPTECWRAIPMPNQNLSRAEIRQYIQYFKWVDAQPPGSLSLSGAGH